ncbi:MAG: NUDIX domain-containing protein, partial [Acidimicrobiales bacterium]
RTQLASLIPVNDREAASIASTLDRLGWPDDPFDEHANEHHLTASAFVVSTRGVILHLHRRMGIWVQPGGHVDAGETPEQGALRETLEETGLVARHLCPPDLFHVDVHPGPRGHTHYDLRFVVLAEPLDPTPSLGESPEVFWFDFDRAQTRCEPALGPALAKLGRAVVSWDVKE